MKANELRPCDLCGEGLCKTGVPLFHRVTFERMAVNPQAVRERASLAMFFSRGTGQANVQANALAEAFASTSEVATRLGNEVDELLVCEGCSLNFDKPLVIAELAERAAHRRISEEAAREASCSPQAAETAR